VCVCTGHFVMVPINLTYPHFLQHFFFEHIFHLYCYHVDIVYDECLNIFMYCQEIVWFKTINYSVCLSVCCSQLTSIRKCPLYVVKRKALKWKGHIELGSSTLFHLKTINAFSKIWLVAIEILILVTMIK